MAVEARPEAAMAAVRLEMRRCGVVGDVGGEPTRPRSGDRKGGGYGGLVVPSTSAPTKATAPDGGGEARRLCDGPRVNGG